MREEMPDGSRYNVRQIMGEKSGEMKGFIKWLCE